MSQSPDAQVPESSGVSKRFMQRLVHEVRSPAHGIHITLRMLEDSLNQVDLTDEAREALALLVSSSEEMRASMRSLARYVHTMDSVQVDKLDAAARVTEVWTKLTATEDDAPEFENQIDRVTLQGDDRLFDLALECILENSIKFQALDRPSKVIVTSEVTDDSLVLRFADNGIGIEAEYMDKCFEDFERLFPRSVYPGAGLGISTIQRSIAHLDGEFSIESTPGVGTTVALRFPRK